MQQPPSPAAPTHVDVSSFVFTSTRLHMSQVTAVRCVVSSLAQITLGMRKYLNGRSTQMKAMVCYLYSAILIYLVKKKNIQFLSEGKFAFVQDIGMIQAVNTGTKQDIDSSVKRLMHTVTTVLY